MISVTKIFKADASHILPNHNGKCANFHGHTYTYEIEVARLQSPGLEDLLQYRGPSKGMVVDFTELTAFWKRSLEPKLDHCHLNDSLKFETGSSFYPTAELIALWVGSQVALWCKEKDLRLIMVRVHEGPGSFATWSPEY